MKSRALRLERVLHLAFGAMLLTGANVVPTRAQELADGCREIPTNEIESALGGKAGKFFNSTMGNARICHGTVGEHKVMIRTTERKANENGEAERKGLEIARQRGWDVNVNTEGELTCATALPPPTATQPAYNKTCSIRRGTNVVAVEVTAPSKDKMVDTEVVKTLVRKAASNL